MDQHMIWELEHLHIVEIARNIKNLSKLKSKEKFRPKSHINPTHPDLSYLDLIFHYNKKSRLLGILL